LRSGARIALGRSRSDGFVSEKSTLVPELAGGRPPWPNTARKHRAKSKRLSAKRRRASCTAEKPRRKSKAGSKPSQLVWPKPARKEQRFLGRRASSGPDYPGLLRNAPGLSCPGFSVLAGFAAAGCRDHGLPCRS